MKKFCFCAFRLRALLLPLGLLAVVTVALLFGGRAAKTASANLSGAMPLIILDAGHGGEDGGAVAADGTMEKDINLSITQKLDVLLQAQGFRTLLTRTDDTLHYDASASSMREKKVADLRYRLQCTEQTPDCVLLSIHQNKFTDPQYDGAQMFYSPNHPQSETLAQCLQDVFVAELQPDNTRKIKQSGTEIFLLYQTKVPAVMAECGFLSNEAERDKLKTDAYQQKVAACIANGLLHYLHQAPIEDIPNTENRT